jgi:AcrR family transcriptional regulator
MAKTHKSVWLQHGYSLFAAHGFSGLKVEVLARNVGKSKSSFYHHFSDVEAFTTLLLKMHNQRAAEMAEQLEAIAGGNGIIDQVFISFRDDMLFHRQLRINRHVPEYQQCIAEVMAIIEPPFVQFLSDILDLSDSKPAVRSLFSFCVDHFLLKITATDFSSDWINQYYQDVSQLVKQLRSIPSGTF